MQTMVKLKNKIKEKIIRHKASLGQLVFYTASSLMSAGLDWCLFLLCRKQFGWHYNVAFSVGKVGGGLADFTVKNCFVFKTGINRTMFLRAAAYALTAFFSLLLGNGIGALFLHFTNLPDSAAKLLTDVICFFINYFIQKKVVFRRLR